MGRARPPLPEGPYLIVGLARSGVAAAEAQQRQQRVRAAQTLFTSGSRALADKSYGEAMDYFSTGVPVIALHGTNRPERVGQAVANGCVRVPNEVVATLSELVPLGTPVTIG